MGMDAGQVGNAVGSTRGIGNFGGASNIQWGKPEQLLSDGSSTGEMAIPGSVEGHLLPGEPKAGEEN